MKNYAFILFFIIASCVSPAIVAQYENVWALGMHAGIDFNYNPPKAITTGIASNEACASIADINGQLLFYTDGTTLWNRQHQPMPSTIYTPSTYGTTSSSQGTVIIPVPGELARYYVFSIISQEDVNAGQLYYSIVDIGLDNGLGNIVPGSNGIPLDTRGILTEHMTAVAGDNCDIWLITFSRLNDGEFLCFNINTAGINHNPVLSKALPSRFDRFSQRIGYIDVSPDRTKIAIAKGDLQLYTFDPATGALTQPVTLLPRSLGAYTFYTYGTAFSPRGSKLYTFATGQWGPSLCQFDLSSGDSLIMVNSRVSVSQEDEAWNSFNALKRAPDGKIYTTSNVDPNQPNTALGIIHHPDLPGKACNFEPFSFTLFPGTTFQGGLPNTNSGIFEHYQKNSSFTLICNQDTLKALHSSGYGYLWQDGITGAERPAGAEGIYWVRYQALGTQCVEEYTDTFKLLHQQWKHTSSASYQEACWGDSIHIAANLPGKSGYTWHDGQTGWKRTVYRSGTYLIKYHEPGEECNNYADSFTIRLPEEQYRLSFLSDSIICQGTPINVVNRSPAYYNDIAWHFGNGDSSSSTQPDYIYDSPGIYNLLLTGNHNGICADTAALTLIVDSNLNTHFVSYPKEICSGQEIFFSHALAGNSVQSLYWSLGDEMYSTIEDSLFQHHYAYPGIKQVRLEARFRACPNAHYTDSVWVHPIPLITLGKDTALCLNGTALVLKNLYPEQAGITHLWSTGAHTPVITISGPGAYSLQVKNIFGCTAEDRITVKKDCYIDIPNAFSPNTDGHNDYFFPKQRQSDAFMDFRMQVFDRWGQKLFETAEKKGRGWDGRFKGKEQPAGVYLYRVTIRLHNGNVQQYEGNVTLIR